MKAFFFGLKPPAMSVALSLVLLLAGCAAEKKPDAWLADKELVIQSLQDAHTNNARLKESIEKLDQRVVYLEAEQVRQQSKIKALEAALAKQKPENKNTGQPKKAVKQSKSLAAKLDKLSAKLNSSVVKPAQANDAETAEKNAYTAAYLALKSGRYEESSYGFSAVIQTYPDGKYTDQAYYWLGESLLAQHRHQEALEAFKLVANKYKQSPKHAAALLKLASVYRTLDKPRLAKEALNRVIKAHPESRSAEQARIQLDKLGNKH